MKKKIMFTVFAFLIFSHLFNSQVVPYNIFSYAVENPIIVEVNNKQIMFDVKPVIIEGRVLIPIKSVVDVLNCEVNWDPDFKEVTITKGSLIIGMYIGDNYAYTNSGSVELDVPPIILNGRTMVPLKAISDLLGAEIKWESSKRLVSIFSDIDDEIFFQNKDLENIIRKSIDKPTGKITKLDVRDLSTLVISGLNENKEQTLKIDDLSPLSNFTGLKRLSLVLISAEDISALSSLVNLEFLYIMGVDIVDLSSISKLVNLEEIIMNGVQVSDLSPLSNLNNLESLYISGDNVQDLTPLSNLTNLKELTVYGDKITDLNPLANLKKLTKLLVGGNSIYDYSPVKDILVKSGFDYYETQATYDHALEIIKNIIKDDMTELEKEKAIHDWMVLNVRYDHENYISKTIPAESYTSYGALVNHVSVCQGYTSATRLLLNIVGIENTVVIGTAGYTNDKANWQGHSWNRVKIDGIWYNLDVTFDDPDNSSYISYRYFNMDDETFRLNHSW